MRAPIKLTMLGAGSGFTPRLVSDVVQIEGHQGGKICLASGRVSSMPLVDLCHSVQGTSHLLARRAGFPTGQSPATRLGSATLEKGTYIGAC